MATAYFWASLKPGIVLRVSSSRVEVPASCATQRAVAVAVADKVCRKFNAVRSAVSMERARPCIWHSRVSAGTVAPSSTCQSSVIDGNIYQIPSDDLAKYMVSKKECASLPVAQEVKPADQYFTIQRPL